MIWLFSNRGLGAPIVVAAARYSRRTGVPISLVYSNVADPDRPLWRRAGTLARRLVWRLDAAVRLRPLRLVIADVNSDAFLSHVRPSDDTVVCGFNQILRHDAIGHFRTIVNIHPSVLPLYRGPAPSVWCLRNGETRTGFTLHELTEKIDAGPVLYQGMVEIGAADRPRDLDRRIARAAVPIFEQYLEHLRALTPWEPRLLDAADVYRTPVSYASSVAPGP